MLATVQLADLGPRGTLRSLLRRPKPEAVPGLRSADTAVLLPLASSRPSVPRRAGLIAFWDDEDAFERFVVRDAVGRAFVEAGGVEARLRPLRAWGSWPGLPPDVDRRRVVPSDGPVVVLTLARLRLSQAVRFLRASRPAERAAVDGEGMVWGTAAVRPPFMATVSIWRDGRAAAGYAYRRTDPHAAAVAAQERRDFHRLSAFVRFAPLRLTGSLEGANPLRTAEVAVSG